MTTTARAHSISETELQEVIIELARHRGYLVSHQRPGTTRDGRMATQITGDPGFPDLVLLRPDRLVVAELKSETERISSGQKDWGDRFRMFCQKVTLTTGDQTMPPVMYQVWRPTDYFDGLVEAVLQ